MDDSIAWYLGSCLLAWSIGWAAGALHRSLVQMLEQSAS